MPEFKNVTPEEFARVDFGAVTLVDLRDEAVRLVQGELAGSLKLPLSQLGTGLSDISRDKPVYVFCDTGDFSEQVAELLADRGYDAYNLRGGFRAFKELEGADALIVESALPGGSSQAGAAVESAPKSCPILPPELRGSAGAAKEQGPHSDIAAPLYVDARGLKCPGPIVKVSDTLKDLESGARVLVLVHTTEDAFASDIRIWCERTGNVLESLETGPDGIEALVVKGSPAPVAASSSVGISGGIPPAAAPDIPHGKTFVVFSGDLDKTIAAFIMANGGAAMGREVTMFFTFWGLNILRRPERVKVAKTPIGRAFGALMPRGTGKLGLSRMNFGGAGAKMIRGVMKANGISSLEELIDTARAHGVRLVACQMSMEIMGITREELIDGVELGGVATFLGSGEQSDMTLFI